MRMASLSSLVAAAFAALGAGAGPALAAETDTRLSGPHVHENLAIYFIHGRGAAGPVPLTLAEAVAKGSVQVIETGRVNELQIENTGDEEVFVQAGDIVKGGKQDRVLTVSLVLPPRSGVIPIASFCVEQGRWSARGEEDNARFASASEAIPSSRARAIMAAPPVSAPSEAIRPAGGPPARSSETASRQQRMWETVAKVQTDLSAQLKARVASPQSATSLQLSLENENLQQARRDYVAALEPFGVKDDDIIGYVVAINGKPVSGDVYTSNGLFRKMWAKQLAAAVTEAIGERSGGAAEPPATGAVQDFMAAAENGRRHERETAFQLRQETRDSEKALYNETRSAAGQWLHKTYVRK